MEPILTTVNEKGEKVKKENRFAQFLRAVFVHNFGYKILAVAAAVALWILAVIL